ncbi:hypothetical protein GCM10029963_24340 [Micromonospora andamanensis]
MAGDLHDAFPAFRRVLAECERVYLAQRDESLLALLCGRQEQPAWTTETAQPALFAFQVALTELWRTFGVAPQRLLGHSIGEYAALCAAGALSIADGMRLTMLRGELMRHRMPPGAMIGILADRLTLDGLLIETPVELAAVNGPEEYVLAGSEASVGQATGWLDRRAIGWRRLPVDRAFHSAAIAPIIDAFAEGVAAVKLSPLSIPMASTVTGRLLAPGTVLDVDYLVRQLRQPVMFADALGTLVADGCSRFLEIGPDAVLCGVGRRTAPGTVWVGAQRRGVPPVRAMEHAVAELYRHGHCPDWTATAGGGRRIPLPSYPFQRERYWIDAAAEVPATSHRPTKAAPVEPAHPTGARADVLATIRDLTARQLGTTPAEVPPDRTFLEVGADSLAMLRVVQEVRQTYGVTLAARELFTEADTPQRLATVVSSRMTPTDPDRTEPGAPAATETPVPSSFPTASVTTLPPSAETPAGELASVIEQQLRLAGQLVDQVTGVMRQHLALLVAHQPGQQPAPPDPPRPGPLSTVAPSRPAALSVADPVRSGSPGCDFSLYFFGSYPDQGQQDKYGTVLDAVRFGDQHGFHAVWFPERHFHPFGGLFPNPVVLAAAVARETTRIRINAGSVVLPLHDPIRVAEEWSVVDNLSGGRVGLCVASGWHANDFALNPDAFGRHRELMYEHLETVRTLWGGASVPARSGSGDQLDVRIFPRPLQQMPPMFVAAVANPETYRCAARLGLGVVTNLMMQSIEQLAENVALYRRTRQEHGLNPDDGRVVVLVHTYLGDDLRRVRSEAFQPFCDYLRSSLSLLGGVTNSLGLQIDQDTPEEDVQFLLERAYASYCEQRALIGTVDSAAPIIDRLAAAGVDEIACFVDFGVTSEQLHRSLHFIDAARKHHKRTAPHRQPERAGAPLSAAQRGMWFLDQMYPGRPSYHEPKAIRLTGSLDVTALRWALDRVVDRHAPLRTVIRDIGGEPQQLILPSVEVDCPLLDMPGTPVQEAVRQIVADLSAEPIELAEGPLLRVRLVRLGPDDHVLVLVVHHIVFDSSPPPSSSGTSPPTTGPGRRSHRRYRRYPSLTRTTSALGWPPRTAPATPGLLAVGAARRTDAAAADRPSPAARRDGTWRLARTPPRCRPDRLRPTVQPAAPRHAVHDPARRHRRRAGSVQRPGRRRAGYRAHRSSARHGEPDRSVHRLGAAAHRPVRGTDLRPDRQADPRHQHRSVRARGRRFRRTDRCGEPGTGSEPEPALPGPCRVRNGHQRRVRPAGGGRRAARRAE